MEKKNKTERNKKKSVRLKTFEEKKSRLITVYHWNVTRLILTAFR